MPVTVSVVNDGQIVVSDGRHEVHVAKTSSCVPLCFVFPNPHHVRTHTFSLSVCYRVGVSISFRR